MESDEKNTKKCNICKKIKKNQLFANNLTCAECFNKPKQKFYFDVKIECLLPATLSYRVYAEDAEKAAEMIKGLKPNSIQHRLFGKKDIKLTVYDAGCSIIKLILNLCNR